MLPYHHRVRVTAERIQGARVLDVGSGECLLAPFVATFYVGTELEVRSEATGLRTVVAPVQALPFRDSAFDTVTCISVMQYVLDIELAMTELRRVTRLGGQVLLLVPNIAYVRNRMTLARGRFPWSSTADSWTGGTIRYFTRHDIEPVMQRVGFRIVDVGCTGRMWRLRSRWPGLVGADLLFDLERI